VTLRFKAHLALLLCALFWGVTFVVVKDALTDSSVFAYLAARFTLAIPPMAWFYRADLRKLSASDFWAGVRIGILMFGGYAFQPLGLPKRLHRSRVYHRIQRGPRARIDSPHLEAPYQWLGMGGRFRLSGGTLLPHRSREGIADLNRGDLLVTGCSVCYALQLFY